MTWVGPGLQTFPVVWLKSTALILDFVPEGELMEKSSHPTAMMLTSTVNLLKTLSLSAGIHAEVLQTDATRTLCGLLRMLVESGANDKSGNRAVTQNKNQSASSPCTPWYHRDDVLYSSRRISS